MPRPSQFPLSPTEVERVAAIVLDHADEMAARDGGSSRVARADAASLRHSAAVLSRSYGTGEGARGEAVNGHPAVTLATEEASA